MPSLMAMRHTRNMHYLGDTETLILLKYSGFSNRVRKEVCLVHMIYLLLPRNTSLVV